MTKKELSQLSNLKKEIKLLEYRLKELEDMSTNITAQITGMPHTSQVSDKVGNYATEITALKDIIKKNKDRVWKERIRLENYISSIDDSLIRQIISYRYVNGLSWAAVACCIGGNNTADSVRKLHDRYLEKQSCPICPDCLC